MIEDLGNGVTKEVNANGTFWRLDGKLHRTEGPAIVEADGSEFWYVNGKRHRTDGPTFKWANGRKEWYLNDKRVTEEEHKRRTSVSKEVL